MNQAKRNRPTVNEAVPTNPSYSNSLADPDHGIDLEGLVAGCHVAVVQVRGEHVPPRYRRRVFFGLAAAQKAIDKATADDLHAEIILCQLVPVPNTREATSK